MTHRRGFTLAELTVTLGISGLAIGLALFAFMSQQRSFEGIEVTRAGQEAARDATLEFERTLRLAGFGIDPRFAFDFRQYRCATPPCRDRVDGPDELVFHSRSVAYRNVPDGTSGCTDSQGCLVGNAWRVTAASATTLSIQAKVGQRFRRGEILLVSCPSASRASMATVQTTTAARTTDGIQDVSLMPAVAGNPYQESAFTDPCYQSGASAFLIQRFHYFVATYASVPWLMLDLGQDLNGNQQTPEEGDAADLLPIARGVEDLQFAYVLGRSATVSAPDSNQNWSIGDKTGTVEEPDPTINAPVYRTGTNDVLRFNLHPANIRAVRVSIGIRTARADPGPPKGWPGDPLALNENRSALLSSSQYGRLRRMTAQTLVTVRNMESRALFIF